MATRAERDGIRECEAFNAFIFHTDEPDEVISVQTGIDPEPEPIVDRKDQNNQRFVFRANRLHGRRRLTRLPEKHSKNYSEITGQTVPEAPTFYTRVVTVRWGHQIESSRPIIPTYILKAPTINYREDFEEQPIQSEQAEDEAVPAELPKGVYLGLNGRFPVQELIRKDSLELLERLKGK